MPASRTSRRCNHLAATALTHIDKIAGSTVVIHILLKYSVFPLPITFTYTIFLGKKSVLLSFIISVDQIFSIEDTLPL
jgi:hypothetical protein